VWKDSTRTRTMNYPGYPNRRPGVDGYLVHLLPGTGG